MVSIHVVVGVLFLANFICTTSQQKDSDVVVKTHSGAIRGLLTRTRRDRDVLAFYGVRYAESPAGKNRFKSPIPVKPWGGVYNATNTGLACMQKDPHPSYTSVSEDCLMLDIYAPTNMRHLKPVIVFIHGGGFQFGAKSDVSHEYLLDHDVVLVSINYRLGAFGFLATRENITSGNWGLKDQSLALKWIQRNIRTFGGDPTLVTLSGHSAGSFCVTAHMVSPISQGLFQRAIAMSGSMFGHTKPTTLEATKYLMEKSYCNDANIELALECLRNISPETILEISATGSLPWFYVIEGKECDQPFLTEEPLEIIKRGEFSHVPLMTGVSKDELFSAVFALYNNQKPVIDQLNSNFDQVASSMFGYLTLSNHDEISSRLRSFYLHNEPITADNIERLGELFSDSFIAHGVHRLMELTRPFVNVFYYRFDYQGRYSHNYKSDGKPLGVIHGDELQYVFVFKKIAPIINITDPENIIIERMTYWWARFAKHGNPNDINSEIINGVKWKATDQSGARSFYINSTCQMSSIEHNKERYELWNKMFPV